MSMHSYEVKTIDGKATKLAAYKGKVTLVVNVASKCGLTPQYKGLEALHAEFGARGFAVLGFPANEFGAQEPGSNQEIAEFCTTNYGVSFDMFEKVVVKGAGIHPLFAELTAPGPFGGEIKWNFNKFLVGKDGEVLARFEPMVGPDDPALRAAIEKALS
jgi:glutathione peroxidase